MERWTDPDFGGDDALRGCDVQNWRRPFQWKRVSDLHKSATLFATIQADNISQGEIGDCWLLAAMAVLADFPGHIMNLFDQTSLSEEGRYTIKLHDIKKGWEDVVVDDLIPCDCQGTPLFAQLVGDSGSMWALLLEKAFAKFVGNYGMLVGGSTSWAWQVLTGQPWMGRWSRESSLQWTRFEVAGLKECFTSDAAAAKWRSSGMRHGSWVGPAETLDDSDMFEALASYAQANYMVSCSIGEGDRAEERRPDGLLAKHAYSMLQVVEAHGHRLVQVRNPWGKGGEWNGAWADDSQKWEQHPDVCSDLVVSHEDDGRFWMPWEAFADVFGKNIIVCPVTLPCPSNSQIVASRGSGTARSASSDKVRCPQCRQPYTRGWVMLVDDGRWHRLSDGKSLCFLCLRATCRATAPGLRLAGVHLQPKFSLAPPRGPRRLEICEYGAACYRRNPQHFHDRFHPSLLPPAPDCSSGCGRSSASGFKTCCQTCQSAPPDLEICVPGEYSKLSGTYAAVPGRISRGGSAVWHQKEGRGWLWKGSVWMMASDEAKVGGTSGLIAQDDGAVRSPHLVENWQVAGPSGWQPLLGMTCKIDASKHAAANHDKLCDQRADREKDLSEQADNVLAKWRKS
eukprot:TRINITY_DN43278_c0_g1_i1.p1 TRINITY_DN43278_c0_g1~~TRINITY_DN43278_c0_g1_i1.p1  ORF type:complete len:623 (+),score=111.70 TRINITY_DN43278_c0_g1_i1:73-1941(+)